jgi:c-di-GMP-binding flagellar brake protein YcgR
MSEPTGREELRRYRRAAAGVRVFYHGEPAERRERAYLEGVAANLSLGGMFLEADEPLPPGALVWLEFQPGVGPGEDPAEELVLRAKAVVRWRQRWRQPHGMGLEFVEFDGVGQHELKEMLERLLEPGG